MEGVLGSFTSSLLVMQMLDFDDLSDSQIDSNESKRIVVDIVDSKVI